MLLQPPTVAVLATRRSTPSSSMASCTSISAPAAKAASGGNHAVSAEKHDLSSAMLEAQREAFGHRRMVYAKRLDPETRFVEDPPSGVLGHGHQVADVRPALVGNTRSMSNSIDWTKFCQQPDVPAGPYTVTARTGPTSTRCGQGHRAPAGGRNEDASRRSVRGLQVHAGIGERPRHAEPAIDHGAPAADLQQGRCRHRAARPHRRATLDAEQDQPFAQDQSPSGVPLNLFFRPAQQSM